MNNKNLAVVLSVLFGVSGLAFAHEHEMGSGVGTQAQTISGEIVDMACYMGHEGKGEKHAECSKMCVQGGAPMGLLTAKGVLYLLVNDHKAEKAYAAAKELAGEQARITGMVAKRGGLTAMIVTKAEKAGKN